MSAIAAARLLTLLILAAGLSLAHAAGLPAPVGRALEDARIPLSDVAIWVRPVDAREPLLAHNADRPLNPASVMKLVTAFAALERLGPAHSWTTRISTTGPVSGGVLDGDLVLTGGADPVLSYERVWKLLRQVRNLGIDTIRGDIVLDGSALRLPRHDPSAFDGRALRPYNSGAHGLLLHFNTLQLRLLPSEKPGSLVTVAAAPALPGLAIDNRITTAGGNCGVWYGNLDATLEAGPTGPRLVLSGSMPGSCGQRDWSAAPLSPEQFGAAVVAGLWSEVGGTLGGTVRAGTTPAGTTSLISETSPPLAEVVREMNKWSSNVIARQLLATLGATDPSALDMVASGAQVVIAQLEAAGIDTAGIVIENGSGLSRIERIPAARLGEMLIAAWQRPYMPEFIAALPVAGLDGTARRRLDGSPARGYAHIKTGSINDVRAIAGYLLDRNGRRHAVVMIVNHPQAGGSHAAQDALLEWLWEGAPAATEAAPPPAEGSGAS
jgi:D-alanyl-D-alanine carboxypeptidase/D-alanyl-D-alanine-endopeptidase (penicillin-binding protein 4)